MLFSAPAAKVTGVAFLFGAAILAIGVANAQERFAGSFRRVVTLPDDADPQRVDAKYRDGILRITVAKRESSKPRRIEVN